MDAFSYLSVLLSLVLGLAITQLLQGVRGMILAGPRVVRYPPTLGWVAALLLIDVQSWWAMFGMREVQHWSFGAFLVVLGQVTVQYLLAALVLPDFPPESGVDLRAHYQAHRLAFFSLLALALAISLSKDLVLGGHWPGAANVAFHAAFFSLSVAAIVVRREWFHQTLAPLTLVLVALYIVLLFGSLPT